MRIVIAFTPLVLAACEEKKQLALTPIEAGRPEAAAAVSECDAILADEKVDKSRLDCATKPPWTWALRVDPADGGAIVQTLIVRGPNVSVKQPSNVAGVEWPPVLGRHTSVYDLDGDGVPEFFAVVPANVKTFTPASRNLVTYKAGAIAPYPIDSSWRVNSVSDKGDLDVSLDLGKRTVCEPTDEERIVLPFTAKLQPKGAFVLEARGCPKAEMFVPSISQAKDAKDLDLLWVQCARAGGKSAADVIAELDKACKPNADATKKCAGPCRHLPDALVVAKFSAPSSK